LLEAEEDKEKNIGKIIKKDAGNTSILGNKCIFNVVPLS